MLTDKRKAASAVPHSASEEEEELEEELEDEEELEEEEDEDEEETEARQLQPNTKRARVENGEDGEEEEDEEEEEEEEDEEEEDGGQGIGKKAGGSGAIEKPSSDLATGAASEIDPLEQLAQAAQLAQLAQLVQQAENHMDIGSAGGKTSGTLEDGAEARAAETGEEVGTPHKVAETIPAKKRAPILTASRVSTAASLRRRAATKDKDGSTKLDELACVVERLRADIRVIYSGNPKSSVDSVRKNFTYARILAKELNKEIQLVEEKFAKETETRKAAAMAAAAAAAAVAAAAVAAAAVAGSTAVGIVDTVSSFSTSDTAHAHVQKDGAYQSAIDPSPGQTAGQDVGQDVPAVETIITARSEEAATSSH